MYLPTLFTLLYLWCVFLSGRLKKQWPRSTHGNMNGWTLLSRTQDCPLTMPGEQSSATPLAFENPILLPPCTFLSTHAFSLDQTSLHPFLCLPGKALLPGVLAPWAAPGLISFFRSRYEMSLSCSKSPSVSTAIYPQDLYCVKSHRKTLSCVGTKF